MSEERSSKRRKSDLATATVKDGITSFNFAHGRVVECDARQLPPDVQVDQAARNLVTFGRGALVRQTDPEAAANALQARFTALKNGTYKVTRAGGRQRKEVDDLTLALSRVLNKPVEFVQNQFYPKWFASKESGVEFKQAGGKTRMYGKKEALEKLPLVYPPLREELNKIAREKGKNLKADKIDLASLAA